MKVDKQFSNNKMGHTSSSQRIIVDLLLGELRDYGKTLQRDERAIFERLLKEPLKHVSKISYANSIHAWAFLLLSIMIEQEKRLKKLEEEHEGLVNGFIQEKELDYLVGEDEE